MARAVGHLRRWLGPGLWLGLSCTLLGCGGGSVEPGISQTRSSPDSQSVPVRAGEPHGGMDKRTGMHNYTLRVAGVERRYALNVPRKSAGGPLPLVLVFHGGEGSPEKIARQTGFDQASDKYGFIVAFPMSIEHWNDGRSSTRGFGDDTAYVAALIDHLVAQANVDPRRVYATGASNGGMMTLRLACEMGDRIAAFAPVIASFPESYVERCKPAAAVPVLMINGTRDVLIRWNGGRIPSGRRAGVGGTVIPVRDTVAFWSEHNGCDRPQIWDLPDPQDDGTRSIREDYTACDSGGATSLIRVEGGGHTWPGTRARTGRLAGKASQDFEATEVIWSFFAEHALH